MNKVPTAFSKHKIDQQEQLKKNFDEFKSEHAELLKRHCNRYALYRNGQRIAILDTYRDAITTGLITGGFPFSAHHITEMPLENWETVSDRQTYDQLMVTLQTSE